MASHLPFLNRLMSLYHVNQCLPFLQIGDAYVYVGCKPKICRHHEKKTDCIGRSPIFKFWIFPVMSYFRRIIHICKSEKSAQKKDCES